MINMRKPTEYFLRAKLRKYIECMFLKRHMFLLLCLLSTFTLNANSSLNSQQDAIERIDYLYSQSIDLPAKLITQLEHIKQQSQVNNWQHSFLSSAVFQAEVYIQN